MALSKVAMIEEGSRPPRDRRNRRIVAAIGVSPSVSEDALQRARSVAGEIFPTENSSSYVEIRTTESESPIYRENLGESCYVCKTHLYDALSSVSRHFSASSSHVVLYNGTNFDDRSDPTRLGLVAASEHNVVSPLDHATKFEVRRIARAFGLSNADTAASPCLRSRLALGVEATVEHLARVADAEAFIRKHLVLDDARSLRVRLLPRDRVAVEVDIEDGSLEAASSDVEIRRYFESVRWGVNDEGECNVAFRKYKYGAVSVASD